MPGPISVFKFISHAIIPGVPIMNIVGNIVIVSTNVSEGKAN